MISVDSEENLLILKTENMRRLKKLLGDRPIFFGSSRKRFLRNILEKSAAHTAELTSDSIKKEEGGGPTIELEEFDWIIPHAESSYLGGKFAKKEEEVRAPTIEELDWATAGTTVAAVSGIL